MFVANRVVDILDKTIVAQRNHVMCIHIQPTLAVEQLVLKNFKEDSGLLASLSWSNWIMKDPR